MQIEEGVMTSSIPPMYRYHCPVCGGLEFDTEKYPMPEVVNELMERPLPASAPFDWDVFRREAAKDVMCAVLSVPGMWTDTTYEGLAAACIKQVDELIERLTRPFDPTGENGADGTKVYRQWESDLLQSATTLVDSVEKYVKQECSRSTLLSMKDKLKELLER